ncbi:MAG TPA: LptF/LptG family permease [Chitinophagales bacterium]|nr:LptF/LptG family permease [Chitinophagales bacterium]
MKLLDRYIIQKYLGTFVFMLSLLTAIAIVIDITEKIDDFIVSKLSVWTIISTYYIHFIPWIVMMLAPIFVFISVVYFTSKLTSDSEVIAILAGRVSFYRLLFPYLLSAGMLAGLFYMMNHYWLPNSNKKLFEFTNEHTSSSVETSKDNVHFQFKKDTLVYVQSWNDVDKSGYKFSVEVFEGRMMIYKLNADRVLWDTIQNNWKIENYIERTVINEQEDDIKDEVEGNFDWGFRPMDFLVQINIKESMTTPELEKFIAEQNAKGAENLQFYEIEKYKRTAVPISTIILTIIAFAMTTKKRRNGMGIYIVAGLAISGIYIMIQQFSAVFSTKGNLEPIWGAWIPNIFFAVIALFLIWRSPK